MTDFNYVHFENFKQKTNFNLDQGSVGHKVHKWCDYVIPNKVSGLPEFLDGKLTRQQLKDICCDKRYSDLFCLAAVMAWGGQNWEHGEMLFKRRDDILPVIQKLRQSKCSPKQAYYEFLGIWKQGKLGMGAAYFTKLIFFCDPNHRGFIMDQWTAKSVNLICGKKIVDLQGGYVSKKNDSDVYERFCNIIEDIARNFTKSGEEIEIAMFSKGGRKKQAWRQYVFDTYETFHRDTR